MNLSTAQGETAHFIAASRGHGECMELLGQSGADVNVRDHSSRTPLYCAAIEGSHGAIKFLLDSGADVNVVDNLGMSPLLYLAGGIKDCEYTPEKGIDDDWYRTDEVGQRKCMTILLEAGADVNAVNNDGKTALLIAIKQKREDFMKLLLQSGADPVKRDGHYTPLIKATESGFENGVCPVFSMPEAIVSDKR